ncbi:MAG: alpha/beta hydrolase family protein, partial [Solimonas sp.]
MPHSRRAILALLLACGGAQAAPDLPPVEAFARLPTMVSPALSPDGGTVAYITSITRPGQPAAQLVATLDLKSPRHTLLPVLSNSEDNMFRAQWCGWANDTRLLCSFGTVTYINGNASGISRLVAVNSDGSKRKVLIQNGLAGASQFHDRILDWTPDDPDTVLIELDDDGDAKPSVFALNVNTGALRQHDRERPPIRHFVADGHGHVRIGWGLDHEDISYFARLDGDLEWRRLATFKAFSGVDVLAPLAVIPGTNKVYAAGPYEGRTALWSIDLEDKTPPQVLAHHPRADIENAIFARSDRRLIGIGYDTEKPAVFYVDANAEAVIDAVGKLLPDHTISIEDTSRDEQVYLLRASNDIDAGRYYILDGRHGDTLTQIGIAYPELDPKTLGRMQPIIYPARDGTTIPGYLTVPPGTAAKNLPLVVMPHGGPIARDRWEFDFLRAFLVSRGYAVLQMNFRGSAGYGSDWFYAAHQDWGGLSYDDVTDGARWAIAQGIADPRRVAIVGWSFGGYIALLGATR